MTITFTCSHCGHTTQAADQFAGQSGPCASCGTQVTIPVPGTAKPAAKAYRRSASSNSSSGAVIGVVIVALLGGLVVCGGVMAALLLPAVQAAREAARRMECSNNLKQVALAMHNYHDTYKTFPPAYIANDAGEPVRSWRALILPFVEEAPLYDRYNFNVPWDSTENQFAISTAIRVYSCPSDPANATDTNYLLLTGTGTIFEVGKNPTFREIRDGTSNTIMAVEMHGSGINWSEPKDMDIETFVGMFGPNGTGSASSSHVGGLNVVLADGSVRFLSFNTDPVTVRGLSTSSGGEQISGQWDTGY